MADAVQLLMEGMISELEDLRKKGIFSKGEIKKIVKKRKEFEYALRRKQPEKADYLRYIQYELDLNALRKKRKKLKGIKRQSAAGEYSGVKRIHFIFERLLQRFYTDISLWNHYIEFCKSSKGTKVLSKVYARAIQAHPLSAELWTSAAKWEFKSNHNISGCRALFHRALRLIKNSQQLWLSYFETELLYLRKVKKRLQADKEPTLKAKEDAISLPTLSEERNNMDDDSNTTQEETNKVSGDPSTSSSIPKDNPFLRGAIPKIIYKNAIQNFRLEFAKLYQKYNGLVEGGVEEVFESIQSTFPNNTDCLKLIAQSRLKATEEDSITAQKNANQVFEDALKNPNCDPNIIWNEYANFCESSILFNPEDKERIEYLTHTLKELFNRAQAKKECNEGLYAKWVNFLLNQGKQKEAASTAATATSAFPGSSSLWLLRIDLMIKERTISGKKKPTNDDIRKTFKEAISKVAANNSIDLWSKYLEFNLLTEEDWSEQMREYQTAIVRAQSDPKASQFRDEFLQRVMLAYGIDKAREVYTKSFQYPPVSLSYFQKCIELENTLASRDINRLRSLYEQALNKYGRTSDSLWLEYMQLENSLKEFKNVATIYWKAKKTLDNPTAFVKECVMQNMQV